MQSVLASRREQRRRDRTHARSARLFWRRKDFLGRAARSRRVSARCPHPLVTERGDQLVVVFCRRDRYCPCSRPRAPASSVPSLSSASASFLSLAGIFLSAWTLRDLRLDHGFGADIFLGRGIEAAEHQADIVDDVVVVVIADEAVLLGDVIELGDHLLVGRGSSPAVCP